MLLRQGRQTGDPLAKWEGLSGVIGVIILKDGRVLTWSEDCTLRLWDGQTGCALATMTGHTGKILDVKVLDDGRILSWSEDCTLRLWDGQTGVLLTTMAGHTGSIEAVEILEDGRILSWTNDATLRLWCGDSGEPVAIPASFKSEERDSWTLPAGACVLLDVETRSQYRSPHQYS